MLKNKKILAIVIIFTIIVIVVILNNFKQTGVDNDDLNIHALLGNIHAPFTHE